MSAGDEQPDDGEVALPKRSLLEAEPRVEQPLTFERASEGRLHFGEEVLERMGAFVQDEPDKLEAGGLLMGRYLKESKDVIVDAVTVPAEGDRRSRHGFYRAQKRHQRTLEHGWQESAHTQTYLGEWHTHPEPIPAPSSQDRSDWIRKLMHDDFGSHLFFLILGTEAVRVWEGRRRQSFVERLHRCGETGEH